jgi:hypothetical protein
MMVKYMKEVGVIIKCMEEVGKLSRMVNVLSFTIKMDIN